MRTLLLSIVFGLAGVSCLAQGLRLGMAFSPQVSTLRIDNSDYGPDDPTRVVQEALKGGYSYGLLCEIPLSPAGRYSLSTGLMVSHTGTSIRHERQAETEGYGQSVSRKMSLQYLEVPVAIKLRAVQIGYVSVIGKFGVVPGVNIRARGEEVVITEQFTETFTNKKITDIFPVNIGMFLLGGIELSLGENTALTGGLFLNNGLTDLINDKDGEKIILNNLGLQVGLLF